MSGPFSLRVRGQSKRWCELRRLPAVGARCGSDPSPFIFKRVNGHPMSCPCPACEALDLHAMARARAHRSEREAVLALEDRGHERLPYGVLAVRS